MPMPAGAPTDGETRRLTLPTVPCGDNRGQFGVPAIDLAKFKVPFQVRTVRIQGCHWLTKTEYYRLAGVRARTVAAPADR